jgi:hypothetical protein
MRALVTVILAVAVLPLLAACGGREEAEQANAYVDAVNQAQSRFTGTFERLSDRLGATSTPGRDRRVLRQFQDAVDDTVARLRGIEVPGAVADLHGQLVAQVASYGEEITRARRALRSADPSRVLEAQTALVSAVTDVSERINATIDAINQRLRER